MLRRNRFYRGPRPHNVSQIVYDIGLPTATIRLNIEDGTTDHGPVPASAHAQLGPRYGVQRRSPGRYFVNPRATLRYLTMNHERALFGKPGGGENAQLGNVPLEASRQLRDRPHGAGRAARRVRGLDLTDQHLPRAIPGFRNAKIYPVPTQPRKGTGTRRRPHAERTRASSIACRSSHLSPGCPDHPGQSA